MGLGLRLPLERVVPRRWGLRGGHRRGRRLGVVGRRLALPGRELRVPGLVGAARLLRRRRMVVRPTGTSGFGSSTGIGGTTTTGSSSSAFGSPGATFGGAPIVGVGLLSKNTSIKVYKKQSHYNQWEFVFDPTQNTVQGTAGAATDLNGASNGVNSGSGTGFSSGSGSGFGSSGGSGSNNGSGFGGTPAAPVNPTSPVTSQ